MTVLSSRSIGPLSTRVIAAAAIALSLSSACSAQCLPTSTSSETNDNLSNNASPFIVANGNDDPELFYDDHNTNEIYVDQSPNESGANGRLGFPQLLTSTTGGAFSIGSGGLGDVTATARSGTVFVDFLNSAGQIEVISGNGVPTTFSERTALSSIGGVTINKAYTPALATYQNTIYMAFVSGSSVYLASSPDGANYNLVSSSPLSVSTISRPSLALYDNSLYIAYTTTQTNQGQAVSGPLFNGTVYSPSLTVYAFRFGYKSLNGQYAGVALVPSNGYLYLTGQSVGSSQYLYSTRSSSGVNFPNSTQCPAQLRWTPSGAGGNNPELVFQSDFNTQIYLNQ